ncbi:MAG: NUDIX hydrolase [bacterium]
MRSLAALAAIFNEAGEVLLVRLSYEHRQWTMRGGHVEPREAPDAAVVREVREETGLDVEVESLFGVYWVREIDGLRLGFRCQVTEGTLEPDGPEILEARYFPPGELPRPITSVTLTRIADALARGPVTVQTVEVVEVLR